MKTAMQDLIEKIQSKQHQCLNDFQTEYQLAINEMLLEAKKIANQKDKILEIKDELISTSHKLSYVLNNIDLLAKDHATLNNVIDEINYLHRKYIDAKMEYTEEYYNQTYN